MSNKNLTEQNAQRTSFDTLELDGYELSEEQLRFVSGGLTGGKTTKKVEESDGTTTTTTCADCDTGSLSRMTNIS